METEEEVDILMSSDVYSATLSTKSITFSRSQIGWLFREDKTVRVAGSGDASRRGKRGPVFLNGRPLVQPTVLRLSL